MRRYQRRIRLAVLTAEQRQINIADLFHRHDEIFAGGGAAVVAGNVAAYASLDFSLNRVYSIRITYAPFSYTSRCKSYFFQ